MKPYLVKQSLAVMTICIVDRLPGVQGIACWLLPIHHLLALLLLALHSNKAASMNTTVQALCWVKPIAELCSACEAPTSQVHWIVKVRYMRTKRKPTGLQAHAR